jgi:anti-sigma factor RsiW
MTSHEEIQELLGVYALDAVDVDERELVERHLEICPRCRAEVAGYRSVTALLGDFGGEAPPALWDRIATQVTAGGESAEQTATDRPLPASIAGWPVSGSAVPSTRALAPARPRAGRVLRAVLAVAAAAVVVLGVEVGILAHRTSQLQQAVGRAPAPSMSAVQQALAVNGARQARLQGPQGASAEAVILPTGTGYLYDVHLPAAGTGHTYQLWGVVGHAAISYGLLGSSPGIEAFQAGSNVAALAVTNEIGTGVVVTDHKPVLLGTVTTS